MGRVRVRVRITVGVGDRAGVKVPALELCLQRARRLRGGGCGGSHAAAELLELLLQRLVRGRVRFRVRVGD